MKVAIVIILIFSLLAFSFTGVMIKIAKDKESNQNKPDSNGTSITTSDISDNTNNKKSDLFRDSLNRPINTKYEYLYDYEKLADSFSTYKESSIEFVTEEIVLDNKYKINNMVKLQGLKDKSVEYKINQDIKSRLLESINNEENVPTELECYFNLYSKLPNVFSAELYVSCIANDNSNFHGTNSIYLNYELVTGERLEFKDLFLNDCDIKQIITQAVYKSYSHPYYEAEIFDEAYDENLVYDSKLGSWKFKDTGEIYTPTYDDYELAKITNKIYKSDNFIYTDDFFQFDIYIDGWVVVNDSFEDFADRLVIFDKYRTKESIFEDDSLGFNIIVFNKANLDMPAHLYQDTKIFDNLFYSSTIGLSYDEAFNNCFIDFRTEFQDGYPINIDEDLKNIKEDLIKASNEELDKYIEYSKKNNKGYIVLLKGEISPYKKDKNQNLRLSTTFQTNILDINLSSKVLEYELDKKDLIIKNFLKDYRYRNLYWYDCAYNYCFGISLNDDYEAGGIDHHYGEHYIEFVENNLINKKYNIFNKQYVDTIEEKDILLLSPIFNSSKYYLFDLNDYYEKERFEDDFEYAQYRLEGCDIDTLNYAYNEIFARHGHDFKTQSLREYFNSFKWYTPIKDKTVGLEDLNENERKNAEMIMKVIKSR